MPLNKRNKYYIHAGVGLAGDRPAVSTLRLISNNNSSGKETTVRPKGDYIL